MRETNYLAALLQGVGQMLEVLESDSYRSRAYLHAARAVEASHYTAEELIEKHMALELKGVGQAMFAHMVEWYQTGSTKLYDELSVKFPSGLWEVLSLPGLGPKKTAALYHSLGISSMAELEYACNENRLLSLPGFGAKTQAKILDAIKTNLLNRGKRLYAAAEPLVAELTGLLTRLSGVETCLVVGEYRRNNPVVSSLEFLLCGNNMDLSPLGPPPEQAESMPEFLSLGFVGEAQGLPVRVFCCPPEYLGTASLYLTGSQQHLNQLPQGTTACYASEAEAYNGRQLEYIPPALREGLGEVEASRARALPKLMTLSDVQGLVHVHTNYSDGSASIRELAEATRGLGFRYLGIADHSQSAYYANGLTLDRAKRQLEEIDKLNRSLQLGNFKIYKGIEVDILSDGQLDYPDELLCRYDFCIASIHSGFRMSKADMTKRIVSAMENPHISIIGHLTGRLLLGRPGYELDIDTVFEAACRTSTALELNASPRRLDIDWQLCRRAKKLGIKVAVNPDAHHIETLLDVRYGVLVAQKAGLEVSDLYTLEG